MDFRKLFMISAFVFVLVAMSMSIMSSPAYASVCGVNVYALDVDGNEIVGYIRNTGDTLEVIDYDIYVNDGVVKSGGFELDPDEARRIEHDYNFGFNEYEIELVAEADCDADDSEVIFHNILEPYICQNPSALNGQDYCDYVNTRYLVCDDGTWIVEDINSGEYCYNCDVCGDDMCNCGETSESCWVDCGNTCNSGYKDTYRCNGAWRQRLYLDHNCNYEWRIWEKCEDECFDGYCVGEGDDNGNGNGGDNGDYDGDCGASIVGFDYISHISSGSPAWVRVIMENTGEDKERLTARLYIDGSHWGSKYSDLNPGAEATKGFNFYLDPGSHDIKIEVRADCGSREIREVVINSQSSGTFPSGCNYNGVCEYGESYNTCPHDCTKPEPSPGYSTSVDIHPNTLDIEKFTTGVVSIDITSARKQTFTITVSGVDTEWTSFPGTVEMETGKKRVYLYVTPDESGTHALGVKVKAESESREFTDTVNFYVSPAQNGAGYGLAGYLIATPAGFAAIVIGIIIIAGIVVYVFYRRIRPDNEYRPVWAKAF